MQLEGCISSFWAGNSFKMRPKFDMLVRITIMTVKVYVQFFIFTLPMLASIFLIRASAPSDDDWQLRWEAFLSLANNNLTIVFGVIPSVVSITGYWIVGALFHLLDVTGWLCEYKVQPETNHPPPSLKLKKALRSVLFNQLVIGLLTGICSFEFLRLTNNMVLSSDDIRVLPTIGILLKRLAAFAFCREIANYYCHRLLHHRLFYKRFHKQHHEWTAPVALMTVCCHPFEHFFNNILPTLVGPGLFQSHPLINAAWFLLVTLRPVFTHSGYHLPFMPSPEFHDFHHMVINQNFGNVGVLDAIHGTDTKWRNSPSFERHFTFFNLMPARKILKLSKEGKLSTKLTI
ncbi:fatty acid hydroxylase domain-containing protein 2-like [Neocloeon triangulifer]|uniref:fatty acid hydroxylase domain-containing protein 2-like n=1 Tax=Neocloeon triangulifer TaxID=2078957 RepID=UPI00286EE334|nr:fatty acid hydroxylase domain-containing protein 2-like [Neocloeon triangulifer]